MFLLTTHFHRVENSDPGHRPSFRSKPVMTIASFEASPEIRSKEIILALMSKVAWISILKKQYKSAANKDKIGMQIAFKH